MTGKYLIYAIVICSLATTKQSLANDIDYSLNGGGKSGMCAAVNCGCCSDCGCDSSCNCSSGCDCNSCCCEDSCGAYGGCCCGDRLFGLFYPSDCRFSDFISPMSNPVYFEDPRNLTEARFIFLNHQIPRTVLGGGPVQLLALQIRAALTERLSIIATKDGYIFAGGGAPAIEGWADVALGLKYNFYANPDSQQLLSCGFTYELASGSQNALQGNGTGEFDIFLAGGTQIGDLAHFVSTAGFRLPTNPNQQNDQFYWSFHFDRRLARRPIYGLLEFNWYHWMTNVPGGLSVGGLDLYNLGSSGVAGTNILTCAFGFKVKPSEKSELGVCYEIPLTDRRDLMENRLTVDYILRY